MDNPILEKSEKTDKQINMLKEAHFKRIELSDAILVANVNNYVGKRNYVLYRINGKN